MKNPFAKNTEKFVDQECFAIYDSVAGTFQQPLFATNSLVVGRELEGLFQDPNHAKNILVTNPEGFSLCKIGQYDRKTGVLEGIAPEHVFTLKEIKSLVMQRQGPITQPTLSQ